MHDNLDFNIQINDDVSDKEKLVKGGLGQGNDSWRNEQDQDLSSLNQSDLQAKKGTNKFNQILSDNTNNNRSDDVLPVTTSAYDLSKSAHPIACIFTFIFKLFALIIYLFFSLKFDNSIFIFVLTISFGAMDFWTVKNVTGRLLVGMRWWNTQNEQGIEEYKYETYGPEYTPNQVDYAFFWSSQLLFFIFWIIIALTKILTPFWLLLNLIMIGMLFTNLYGFYKCKSEHQSKVNSVKDKLKLKGFSFLTNYLMKK